MNKVIQDGKVAVVVSNDWGSGWYTSWFAENITEGRERLLFDSELVNIVLEFKEEQMTAEQYWDALEAFLHAHGFINDQEDVINTPELTIEWVPIGTEFIIHQYDGYESVWEKEKLSWMIA